MTARALLRVAGLATRVAALAVWATAAAAEPLPLETQREPLNPEDRGQILAGQLEYRGGLSITSPDRRFGGLSGLVVESDGRAFLAVTDAGNWVSAPLVHDAAGWLVGLGPGRIGHLPGANGRKMKGKRSQDAEALTRLADGSLLVGFEHKHRIWRYAGTEPPFAGKPQALPAPPGLSALPKNNGLEAMVSLADRRLLVLTQDRNGDGVFPAYLWRERRWSTLAYPAVGGYEPSGAAQLPDGNLIVLERSYSLVGGLLARLMRLDAAQLEPGGALTPQVLGVLKPPQTLDNFEAIDSRRSASGETLVYILSDDNFSAWQRTLLLQFAVID